MESVPLIILSAFAALGIIFLSHLFSAMLFYRVLKRSVMVVPFGSKDEPIAETLRVVSHTGLPVVAVDLAGDIDGSRYVEQGLCREFLKPNELCGLYSGHSRRL